MRFQAQSISASIFIQQMLLKQFCLANDQRVGRLSSKVLQPNGQLGFLHVLGARVEASWGWVEMVGLSTLATCNFMTNTNRHQICIKWLNMFYPSMFFGVQVYMYPIEKYWKRMKSPVCCPRIAACSVQCCRRCFDTTIFASSAQFCAHKSSLDLTSAKAWLEISNFHSIRLQLLRKRFHLDLKQAQATSSATSRKAKSKAPNIQPFATCCRPDVHCWKQADNARR